MTQDRWRDPQAEADQAREVWAEANEKFVKTAAEIRKKWPWRRHPIVRLVLWNAERKRRQINEKLG